MKGVVAGVRDYGNRMGIPTVNGAVCFDPRYLGNPLVFCGTVGLIPVDRCHKAGPARRPDRRRRRPDRPRRHPRRDVLLDRADQRLGEGLRRRRADRQRHHREEGARRASCRPATAGSITPSPIAAPAASARPSARWARSSAPRSSSTRRRSKYDGLSYTEIWISEAQERMVLAVPPENWAELADALRTARTSRRPSSATFEPTGRLQLLYQSQQVADLAWTSCTTAGRRWCGKATSACGCRVSDQDRRPLRRQSKTCDETLLKILGILNVCSKEWIIRQYDHEVQGGSVIKPLVGVRNDGPGDAAVDPAGARFVARAWRSAAASTRATATSTRTRWPRWRSTRRCAMRRRRRRSAAGSPCSTISAGATPSGPEVLGSLVRAAEACRDVALAYSTPFISGKDSLNNEFHAQNQAHRHPADAAYQRPGPRARRPPLRDDGPEGAGQHASF